MTDDILGKAYDGTKILKPATPPSDPLVKRVIEKMHDRSVAGMRKFGVTMERPDVSTIKWLESAQEEALDLAVYLQRIIEDLKNGQS